MDWEQTLEAMVQRARPLAASADRHLLGIAGPPGGGKSTLAQAVVERLAPAACYVPMDGFHLSNTELHRLGRRDRKGAPDTFDADGYVALLRRLRDRGPRTVYAPAFSRGLDEAVAGVIPVGPEIPLVVTEGNYLLVDDGPWAAVQPLLDETWYVVIDEETRVEQLLQRHIAFGKTPDAARAWVHGTDQRNAELVARTRKRADLVVEVPASRHAERSTAPHDAYAHNAGHGDTSRKETSDD